MTETHRTVKMDSKRLCACESTCVCVCEYRCVCTCVWLCVCKCVNVCVRMCVRVSVCVCACTCKKTHGEWEIRQIDDHNTPYSSLLKRGEQIHDDDKKNNLKVCVVVVHLVCLEDRLFRKRRFQGKCQDVAVRFGSFLHSLKAFSNAYHIKLNRQRRIEKLKSWYSRSVLPNLFWFFSTLAKLSTVYTRV